MLGFLVSLANFVIAFVVNLLLVGVGTVAGTTCRTADNSYDGRNLVKNITALVPCKSGA